MEQSLYITSPIYYPNGNPHIGHCYTTVACDTLARYHRLKNRAVFFITGTDEHGLKIEQKSQSIGLNPQTFVDGITENFKTLWANMQVHYNRFVRTTNDYHVQTVQAVFQTLYDRGWIYKGTYTGKYCAPCETFWTAKQLKDGNCPDCNRSVIDAHEEAYFFKLSAFTDQIHALLTNDTFLQPHERAQELINNFVQPGLSDLCVSRTGVRWGIPVPFDPKHTVYVWFDALLSYLSVLGYRNERFHEFETFWPKNSSTGSVVHMVAKDIMRFHAIVWPALLMALELPLPQTLAVHGWITVDGEKMSKSRGNVVDPTWLVERYGVDAMRYYLLREITLDYDTAFSNEIMLNRINADLANGLGNLVSRTIAMVEKYFGGQLPSERTPSAEDETLTTHAQALRSKVDTAMQAIRCHEALGEIFNLVDIANRYIDATAPWKLAKDPAQNARLATVLYNLLETLRIVSGLLEPFMPVTMPCLWEQIGTTAADETYEKLGVWGILPPNATVHKGKILFPKRDVEEELALLTAVHS